MLEDRYRAQLAADKQPNAIERLLAFERACDEKRRRQDPTISKLTAFMKKAQP